jgi:hypothetical protein
MLCVMPNAVLRPRTSCRRRAPGAIAVAALLAASGCRSLPPATVPPSAPAEPAALPARFQAWTLYEVGGQLVYAVDEDEAEEAGALAAAAAADFAARTGRTPSARLLLVADHDVWLPGDDPCRRLQLVQEGLVALHPAGAATRGGIGETTYASCADFQAESEEHGVEPRDMLGLMPHPVPLARLVEDFGLPQGAGAAWDWAVLLPAEDCVEDGIGHVLDAGMERELDFAERLLAAPLMPFVRGVAVDQLLARQKVLLFELHAAAQADWPQEQRERLSRDYGDALERGVEESMSPPPEAGGSH